MSNLVVNGVEVTSYVEAELDRRHPVRLLHVVLGEEWAHHGFCVRDLDLLGR